MYFSAISDITPRPTAPSSNYFNRFIKLKKLLNYV